MVSEPLGAPIGGAVQAKVLFANAVFIMVLQKVRALGSTCPESAGSTCWMSAASNITGSPRAKYEFEKYCDVKFDGCVYTACGMLTHMTPHNKNTQPHTPLHTEHIHVHSKTHVHT